MNMSKNANDSDRRMFLFIHDVESQGNDQLREDFYDEICFEVFGRVGHDHRKRFFKTVKESFLVVTLSEVNRHPVGNLFVLRCKINRFFHKCFQRYVIIVGFSVFYESRSWNL